MHASAATQQCVAASQYGADAGHSQRGTHCCVQTGAGAVQVALHADPHSDQTMPRGAQLGGGCGARELE